MRLDSPWLLLAVVPIALAAAFGFWRLLRRPTALRFPTLKWVELARPPILGRMWWIPQALAAIGLALAVFALARPQVRDTQEREGEGADFVIAIDMSGSMNAVDLQPEAILEYHRQGREPPNRFEAARETLRAFMRSRDTDRIALVIFASKAYLKFPLTLDTSAMNRILDGLVLDDGLRTAPGGCGNGCTIDGESTAIGDALARSYRRLEDSETKSRNILLITDGDNNSGKAAPEELAKFIGEQSADRPVRVFTFLVGAGKDSFVPSRHPLTGRPVVTPEGRKVYERPKEPFPTNPALLRQIASLTGGSYHEAATEEDFRREFEELEKTEFRTPPSYRPEDAFVGPLAVGFALLLLGELLGLTVFRRWP